MRKPDECHLTGQPKHPEYPKQNLQGLPKIHTRDSCTQTQDSKDELLRIKIDTADSWTQTQDSQDEPTDLSKYSLFFILCGYMIHHSLFYVSCSLCR